MLRVRATKISLVIVALTSPAFAQDVWRNVEVDTYIRANQPRPQTASSDPFAIPPVPPAPAAHVVLEYRVRGQNQPQGQEGIDPASWTYNPAAQIMRISIKAPRGSGSTVPQPRETFWTRWGHCQT